MIYINRLKDLSKRYVQVVEDIRIRGRASTYKRGREYIGVVAGMYMLWGNKA